jgi:hypothetical protein
MIRKVVSEPPVPGSVNFADSTQLRIGIFDAFHESHDPKIDARKMRIGAVVVADHHCALSFKLRERPLEVLRAYIQSTY